MKGEILQSLATRIRQELDDLERAVNRIVQGWEQFRRHQDEFYLDSVALNLHGFNSGLEG